MRHKDHFKVKALRGSILYRGLMGTNVELTFIFLIAALVQVNILV